MAFYFILKALQLPPGSEVVIPALTFWVIPELARVAGLTVRFADINPATFCLDPAALEAAITDRTRVVVPTHLFGLPCEMDPILGIAARHNLVVVEDCAHALGAEYRGRAAGTLGHAAFFSFQTLKPLNTYGGGMAVTGDDLLAARVREQVDALPWPSEQRISKKLLVGKAQRVFTHPTGFGWSTFPVLWAASFVGGKPDVYFREKIRRLDPMPPDYMERYSNVQAVLGLAGLPLLDDWTATTRGNARTISEAVAGIEGIHPPVEPGDRRHVFYQVLPVWPRTRRPCALLHPEGRRYRDAPRRRLHGTRSLRSGADAGPGSPCLSRRHPGAGVRVVEHGAPAEGGERRPAGPSRLDIGGCRVARGAAQGVGLVNPGEWPGGLAYLVVFAAALLEGEVVFLAASVLVAKGYLHPAGVLVAGALGGAAGDNLWFHALRGRLERWLRRVPRVAARHDIIVARVRRHATGMIVGLRFMVGLRVAICAACAYSRVPAGRFAALNLVGAFAWAAALLAIVSWGGPAAMAWLGFRGWWAIGIAPLLILCFTWWLGHKSAVPSA